MAKLAAFCVVLGALLIGWKFRHPLRHAFDPAPPALPLGWVDKFPTPLQIDSGQRSNVFYVGRPLFFKLSQSAARWEVRSYTARVVDSGGATDRISVKSQPPGWYKLYVYGETDRGAPFGKIIGGTTFCIFRNDARFPALPSRDVPGGSLSNDEPMRGVLGMGPQRLRVDDAAKPDEAISQIAQDVALDKKYYLPFDPARKRVLFCAFPNGTEGKEAGVRKIVARFQHDIQYWEPRNEPNGGASGRDFALNEMKPFYETVKSVNPQLKVIGPGTVSLNPDMQKWLDDFFAAGGGQWIDAFSFHAYNNVNGDIWLARQALTTTNALLTKYGQQKKAKWQTEQGNMAAIYGVYAPAHQARWTMTQMMIFEQFGIPKEHNHLWYDRSHGFWNVPAWWENDDGSLNPEAATMRVWSEELFGKTFHRVLDFGSANTLVLGSEFSSSNGKLQILMSAGATDARVQLRVTSASVKSPTKTLRVISAWGVAREVPIAKGTVSLIVPELPLYIEPKSGQMVEAVRQNWGANFARQSGVAVAASQMADAKGRVDGDNDIGKIVNGEQENWYWNQQTAMHPWNVYNPTLPMTVDITLPSVQSVGRVLIYAAPPWQMQSSLLSFDVQVEQNGTWKTVAQVREPARTWKVWTPSTRTSVDSFHSDRWIFPTTFAPVATAKVRLFIRDTTFGGGATEIVDQTGGQAWDKHIAMLREVEIYGR